MKLDSDIIMTLERRTPLGAFVETKHLVKEAADRLLHFCPELGFKREHQQPYVFAQLVHYEQTKNALEIGYAIHQGVQVKG